MCRIRPVPGGADAKDSYCNYKVLLFLLLVNIDLVNDFFLCMFESVSGSWDIATVSLVYGYLYVLR